MNTHNQIKFGEFEDCYSAYIPNTLKTESTTTTMQEVFEKTCEVIDNISHVVMTTKFRKVSAQLLKWIQEEIVSLSYLKYDLRNMPMQNHIGVHFTFLSVDQSNQSQVSHFYQKIISDRLTDKYLLSDSVQMNFQDALIIQSLAFQHYEQTKTIEEDQFQQLALISTFVLKCLQKQYKSKASAHTTIFLLEGVYNLQSQYLSDLKKILMEEIEFKHPQIFAKLIFILPASDQMILNYRENGFCNKKENSLCDPRKVMVDLVLQLITNPCVPLLSLDIYDQLTNEFQTYFTSYQDQLSKMKLAYYNLFATFSENKLQLVLRTYRDQPSKDQLYVDYLKVRYQLKIAIKGFLDFIKELKLQFQYKLENLKVRMFNVLLAQSATNFFQMPGDTNDVDRAISVFANIKTEDETINKFIMNAEMKIKIGTGSIKKESDRGLKMIQQQQYSEKKYRFEEQVNQYMNTFILGTLTKLRGLYSQYIYNDVNLFNRMVAPDILAEYHQVMMSKSSHSHIKPTQILYTKCARMGSQTKATELIEDDVQQFYNSIGELKILGLIEDTKKQRPTYQKSFYAKSMYSNIYAD